MKDVELKMIERAKELLASGEVARVIGWKKGEFYFDPVPASFETVEELDSFVYNYFCGANLSKYLIQMSKKEGKTAVFLKSCDTYSFNQLVKEYRIKRENHSRTLLWPRKSYVYFKGIPAGRGRRNPLRLSPWRLPLRYGQLLHEKKNRAFVQLP